MKKLKFIFISSLFVALAIVSCKKKEDVPQAASETSSTALHKEVSIYDSTGQYSVTYRVEAYKADVLESVVTSLRNSKIKVADSEKISASQFALAPYTPGKEALSQNEIDPKSNVNLVEVNKNIGSHKGYTMCLPSTDNSRTDGTILSGFGTFTVQLWCTSWLVINRFQFDCQVNFYETTTGMMWVNDESVRLSYNSYHRTSNGYSCLRRMVVTPVMQSFRYVGVEYSVY